eukprot:4243246-Amphidinium_carterae.1
MRNLCILLHQTKQCLPNFLVIGASAAERDRHQLVRDGTTTLYNLMASHPQIVPPAKKEALFLYAWQRKHVCDPPETRPTREELLTYAEVAGFPTLDAM